MSKSFQKKLKFLLRLGFWQHLTGLADEHGEVIAVIDISNIEVILCSFVGRTQIFNAQQRTNGICELQVKVVVADEPEDLPVAVDAVITEHLLRSNLACASTLVDNVLH